MRLYYSFEKYDGAATYVAAIKLAAEKHKCVFFEAVPFRIHGESSDYMVFSTTPIDWHHVRDDFDNGNCELPWLDGVVVP